jgi:4-alpha-glucanotransferase
VRVSQSPAPSPRLLELAQAYGVATEFWDWQGRHVPVPERTIVTVLSALDVDASGAAEVEVALEDVALAPWRRMVPPVIVTRAGVPRRVAVHVPDGEPVDVWVQLEDGRRRSLAQEDQWVGPRSVDGVLIGEASFGIPVDLPLGWHCLHARTPSRAARCPLVVTPARLELPAALTERRRWGLMTQLYSVRSCRSWGLGDFADLGELAAWAGRDLGADFVLVNPLHAAEPVGRMEPSPYLPTTRRFVNPIYIRVEDIRETAYLPATDRALVEWEAESPRGSNGDPRLIDRDAVWSAKRSALERVFAVRRSPAREAELQAYRRREGAGLEDFAFWCAMAEHYGLPSSRWPQAAHDPESDTVAALRPALADRVEFYRWLQWVADAQIEAAQATARRAGMRIGVVTDLAVGVHPSGADTWTLQGVLARGVTVGAPPDAFNQQGQDWSQPPWRPDALAEQGYAPYRDMLRTVLRHAGGVRVDHIAGLFRLWWVPLGDGPAAGTYVRYDHEALVGILCLEAHRAGAFVVGEDLGTVEPWVRNYLADCGMMGTSILWFEKDGQGRPLEPEQWRELCLGTVTTHDLPPTAGYLAGGHIELRESLGLLTRPLAEEMAVDEADRAAVMDLLRRRGLLGDDASEQAVVEALYRFLTLTPCRLLGVSLSDAVGDRRTQNQPGTSDEYPNWRLPLADGSGATVLLENLRRLPRALSLARVMSQPSSL